MTKPYRPIDDCPKCRKTYLACPECGNCDRNLSHEGQPCRCGRGSLLLKVSVICCQIHHHHLHNRCEHCGTMG